MNIPKVFPAALTLIHCSDKASLPCNIYVDTVESNGLLKKEYILSILIRNPSKLYKIFWKKVTFMKRKP